VFQCRGERSPLPLTRAGSKISYGIARISPADFHSLREAGIIRFYKLQISCQNLFSRLTFASSLLPKAEKAVVAAILRIYFFTSAEKIIKKCTSCDTGKCTFSHFRNFQSRQEFNFLSFSQNPASLEKKNGVLGGGSRP
jgi:hypothetical protein